MEILRSVSWALCAVLMIAGSAPAAMSIKPGAGGARSEKADAERTAPAPKAEEKAPPVSAPAAVAPATPPTQEPVRPGGLIAVPKLEMCGIVIYAKGGRVVAELKGGAAPREPLRVYDDRTRYRGEAVVVKGLDAATYIVEPVGGFSLAVGDRLSRTPK